MYKRYINIIIIIIIIIIMIRKEWHHLFIAVHIIATNLGEIETLGKTIENAFSKVSCLL